MEGLDRLFAEHSQNLACLILEAATATEPSSGFLERVRELCTRFGTVLILDEMITGFRWHRGGAQTYYGISPDLSTFGKAIGNGFSVSALAGKRDLMDLGGISHDRERVFLLSTTHGAETHALAAAVETMRIYKNEPVVEHLHSAGETLRKGILDAAERTGVAGFFEVTGRSCNLVYVTRDANRTPSQAFRTLFLQETIRRGLLAPSLVTSYSHSQRDVELTVGIIEDSLSIYKKALEDGTEKYLDGRSVKPVFRKFN
jgi:glutamate-1-semialdehyde 2,1-aminomutase